MDWVLVAQALNLLGCVGYYCVLAVASLPSLLFYYLGLRRASGASDAPGAAVFYEGDVVHVRRAPKVNTFRYAVRMALVDLDKPPAWFKAQSADHMTAAEARAFAGTKGPVKLLTDPMAAGYVQNPISVYYCYEPVAQAKGSTGSQLARCIAEVSNTPWNERVTFVFSPAGQDVRKALHVSPFMDMQNTWHLEAPDPGASLRLVVLASHPEYGAYFTAELFAVRAARPGLLNEEAGLRALLRYGFMPHRVALLIYWQAAKLVYKGVPLYMPPDKAYQRELVAEDDASDTQSDGKSGAQASAQRSGDNGGGAAASSNGRGGGMCPVAALARGAAQHTHPRNGANGRHFVWRDAPGWPWK